jgi:hypothetical protein
MIPQAEASDRGAAASSDATRAVQRELARLVEAASDIDLMVISDGLTYADLFGALGDAADQLGRSMNPRIHTSADLARRLDEDNSLLTKVGRLDAKAVMLMCVYVTSPPRDRQKRSFSRP